eukprot:GEMP01049431.1.p1 GENE.GEMP01049431.1~~GEMP01049431.1.p1  ORF type:complete len:288 (+),score=49.74 GEMP01049431.1:273-1136(+)
MPVMNPGTAGRSVVAERRLDRMRVVVTFKEFFVSCLLVGVEALGVACGLLYLQPDDMSLEGDMKLVGAAVLQIILAPVMIILSYGAALHWNRCIPLYFLTLALLSVLITYTASNLMTVANIFFHAWHFLFEIAAVVAYRRYVESLFFLLEWGMSVDKLYETEAQPAVEDGILELKCRYSGRFDMDEDELEDDAPKEVLKGNRFEAYILNARRNKIAAQRQTKTADVDTSYHAALQGQANVRELRVNDWAAALEDVEQIPKVEISNLKGHPNGPMETATIRPKWGLDE